jgi:hypothetical protein
MITLNVNGVRHEVQVPDDTPLLYVLRNDLRLIGPQFGCGLAQCGACAVLVEGKEVRSCITAVAGVANQEITTLEGLPARWAKQKGLSAEGTIHGIRVEALEALASSLAPFVGKSQEWAEAYIKEVKQNRALTKQRYEEAVRFATSLL